MPARLAASLLALLVLIALLMGPELPGVVRQAALIHPTPDGHLLVAVLDVGQADSILVRAPSGRSMLVDAGDSSEDIEGVVLPYLGRLGIQRLNYLVLTHPDQDHVGGMPALLERVQVGTFLDSRQETTNRAYMRTLELVLNKGITARTARLGRDPPDLGPEVVTELLWPPENLLAVGSSVTNNNSVVLRLRYGDVAILLTGDIEREAEEQLVAEATDIRSHVLKVPHHGSRSSSTSRFVRAVRPEVALISAGRNNRYGHPHPEVVNRYLNAGAQVYRTDVHGTITVTIDRQGYTVSTEH